MYRFAFSHPRILSSLPWKLHIRLDIFFIIFFQCFNKVIQLRPSDLAGDDVFPLIESGQVHLQDWVKIAVRYSWITFCHIFKRIIFWKKELNLFKLETNIYFPRNLFNNNWYGCACGDDNLCFQVQNAFIFSDHYVAFPSNRSTIAKTLCGTS